MIEYNQSSDDTIENRTISKNKIINCTKSLINVQEDYKYRNNTLITEIMQKIMFLSQNGKTFANGDAFSIIQINSPEFINEKNSYLSQNRKESINHQTDLIKDCELTVSVSQEQNINSVNEPTIEPTIDFKSFGLIPSENKKEREKAIKDGRTNLFSLIPIEPSKIPAKTPSPKIKKDNPKEVRDQWVPVGESESGSKADVSSSYWTIGSNQNIRIYYFRFSSMRDENYQKGVLAAANCTKRTYTYEVSGDGQHFKISTHDYDWKLTSPDSLGRKIVETICM